MRSDAPLDGPPGIMVYKLMSLIPSTPTTILSTSDTNSLISEADILPWAFTRTNPNCGSESEKKIAPRPKLLYAIKLPTSTLIVSTIVSQAWRLHQPSSRAYRPVMPASVVGSPFSMMSRSCRNLSCPLAAFPNTAPMAGPNTSAYKRLPSNTVKTVTGR